MSEMHCGPCESRCANCPIDWTRFQPASQPSADQPINHAEAYELALMKQSESNLARCYLALRSASGAEPVAWQRRRLLGNAKVTTPFWTEWEDCPQADFDRAIADPDTQLRALYASPVARQPLTEEGLMLVFNEIYPKDCTNLQINWNGGHVLPMDLMSASGRWHEFQRNARAIERALGIPAPQAGKEPDSAP